MHHKQESVAMLSSILPDKPPFIATPPRKTPGWHKRSCAALLGATTLMSMSLSGPASTPAAAQQPAQKPNILFIMGDDIGWMQPSIYHHGLMVGETPNIDRIGKKARCSWTTSPCRAAPPGAMPSSPACIRCAPA